MRPAFLPAETTMVTGSAARGCGGQPQYRMPPAFRLLREAAEAAAIIWSGPLYPQARERAQRQLRRALGDLRAVSTELAAADRRPELHAFSHCLDSAAGHLRAVLPPQLQPPPAGTAASDLPRCSE